MECPRIFGEGVKKVWKVSFTQLKENLTNNEQFVRLIQNEIAMKFSLPFPDMYENSDTISSSSKLHYAAFYVDYEMDSELILLDEHSVEEFILQEKKMIIIKYQKTEILVYKETNTNESQSKATVEAEIGVRGGQGQGGVGLSDVSMHVDVDNEAYAKEEKEKIEQSQGNKSLLGMEQEAQNESLARAKFTSIEANSPHSLAHTPWVEIDWDISSKNIKESNLSLYAVNGVRLQNLQKSVCIALLRQRQRPMMLTFADASMSVTDGWKLSSALPKDAIPLLPAPENVDRISMSLFNSKYSHPQAKKLRSVVDKSIQSFIETDWSNVSRNSIVSNNNSYQSSPEYFILTLYKSIEAEVKNLGLFDSRVPQGGGSPKTMVCMWIHIDICIVYGVCVLYVHACLYV